GEVRDATAERGGAALPGRLRALAVRAILLDALHGEGPPSHDVVRRRAGLAERPGDRALGQVHLRGPVAGRLGLALRGHRGAAAHPDRITDHDRAGVAARLLALVLRIDVAPRAGGADDGLGLDLDQQLRVN